MDENGKSPRLPRGDSMTDKLCSLAELLVETGTFQAAAYASPKARKTGYASPTARAMARQIKAFESEEEGYHQSLSQIQDELELFSRNKYTRNRASPDLSECPSVDTLSSKLSNLANEFATVDRIIDCAKASINAEAENFHGSSGGTKIALLCPLEGTLEHRLIRTASLFREVGICMLSRLLNGMDSIALCLVPENEAIDGKDVWGKPDATSIVFQRIVRDANKSNFGVRLPTLHGLLPQLIEHLLENSKVKTVEILCGQQYWEKISSVQEGFLKLYASELNKQVDLCCLHGLRVTFRDSTNGGIAHAMFIETKLPDSLEEMETLEKIAKQLHNEPQLPADFQNPCQSFVEKSIAEWFLSLSGSHVVLPSESWVPLGHRLVDYSNSKRKVASSDFFQLSFHSMKRYQEDVRVDESLLISIDYPESCILEVFGGQNMSKRESINHSTLKVVSSMFVKHCLSTALVQVSGTLQIQAMRSICQQLSQKQKHKNDTNEARLQCLRQSCIVLKNQRDDATTQLAKLRLTLEEKEKKIQHIEEESKARAARCKWLEEKSLDVAKTQPGDFNREGDRSRGFKLGEMAVPNLETEEKEDVGRESAVLANRLKSPRSPKSPPPMSFSNPISPKHKARMKEMVFQICKLKAQVEQWKSIASKNKTTAVILEKMKNPEEDLKKITAQLQTLEQRVIHANGSEPPIVASAILKNVTPEGDAFWKSQQQLIRKHADEIQVKTVEIDHLHRKVTSLTRQLLRSTCAAEESEKRLLGETKLLQKAKEEARASNEKVRTLELKLKNLKARVALDDAKKEEIIRRKLEKEHTQKLSAVQARLDILTKKHKLAKSELNCKTEHIVQLTSKLQFLEEWKAQTSKNILLKNIVIEKMQDAKNGAPQFLDEEHKMRSIVGIVLMSHISGAQATVERVIMQKELLEKVISRKEREEALRINARKHVRSVQKHNRVTTVDNETVPICSVQHGRRSSRGGSKLKRVSRSQSPTGSRQGKLVTLGAGGSMLEQENLRLKHKLEKAAHQAIGLHASRLALRRSLSKIDERPVPEELHTIVYDLQDLHKKVAEMEAVEMEQLKEENESLQQELVKSRQATETLKLLGARDNINLTARITNVQQRYELEHVTRMSLEHSLSAVQQQLENAKFSISLHLEANSELAARLTEEKSKDVASCLDRYVLDESITGSKQTRVSRILGDLRATLESVQPFLRLKQELKQFPVKQSPT